MLSIPLVLGRYRRREFLEETMLMDFSGPHQLWKYFRQKYSMYLIQFLVSECKTVCTVHRACDVSKLPLSWAGVADVLSFWSDSISAVVGGGRMSTSAFTLQTISFFGCTGQPAFFPWKDPFSRLWSVRKMKYFPSRQRWRCFIPSTTT